MTDTARELSRSATLWELIARRAALTPDATVLIEATHQRDPVGTPRASRAVRKPRLSYRVNLGRPTVGSGSRDATVRISYLVVAGT